MRRSSNVSEEGSRRSVEQYCLTLGELYKASERASRAPVSYTRRFVAQESTRSTFWRERSARTVAEAGTALAVPGHRAQSPLTASCRVRSRDMTERELPSQVRERSPKRRDRPRDGRQRRATWQHSHSCSTAAVTVKAKSRPAVGRCSAACPLSVFALSPVLLRDCCLSLFLFLLASLCTSFSQTWHPGPGDGRRQQGTLPTCCTWRSHSYEMWSSRFRDKTRLQDKSKNSCLLYSLPRLQWSCSKDPSLNSYPV